MHHMCKKREITNILDANSSGTRTTINMYKLQTIMYNFIYLESYCMTLHFTRCGQM